MEVIIVHIFILNNHLALLQKLYTITFTFLALFKSVNISNLQWYLLEGWVIMALIV